MSDFTAFAVVETGDDYGIRGIFKTIEEAHNEIKRIIDDSMAETWFNYSYARYLSTDEAQIMWGLFVEKFLSIYDKTGNEIYRPKKAEQKYNDILKIALSHKQEMLCERFGMDNN